MVDDVTIANMFGQPKMFGVQDVDAARRFAYEQMRLPGQGETGGPGIGSSNAWQTLGSLINRMNATALTHGTYSAQSRMAGANARPQEVEMAPYNQGPNPYKNVPPSSQHAPQQPQRKAEGHVPAPERNNNPGAQYPSNIAKKFGATGYEKLKDGNLIATFSNAVGGAAAQLALLDQNYVGLPLWRAISKWSGGNNVGSYLATLRQLTGLGHDTVITPELLRSPQGVQLAKAMADHENGRPFPLDENGWLQAQKIAFGGAPDQPNAEPRLGVEVNKQGVPNTPAGWQPQPQAPQLEHGIPPQTPQAVPGGGPQQNIPQGDQPPTNVAASPDNQVSPITTGSIGGNNQMSGATPSGDPAWQDPGQEQPQQVAQANPPATTPTINAPSNYGVGGIPTSKTPYQQGWTDIERQVQSMVPPPIQFDQSIFRDVLGAGGDQKTLDSLKEAIKKQNGPQVVPWTGGNWSVDPLGRRKPVFIPDLKEAPIKVPGYEGKEYFSLGPDPNHPTLNQYTPQGNAGGGGEAPGRQGAASGEFPHGGTVREKSDWGIGAESRLTSAKHEAEKDVGIVEEAKSAVPQARMQLQNLKNLQKLSEAAGYGWAPTIQKWLAEHGLNTKGAGEVQAYQSALNYLAPRLRPEGSGRLLGTELQAFYDALGGLFMTPEGRRITFDNFSKIYEYQIAMGKIAQNTNLTPQERIRQINDIDVPELKIPSQEKKETGKEGIWYSNGSQRIQLRGGKWYNEDGSEYKAK